MSVHLFDLEIHPLAHTSAEWTKQKARTSGEFGAGVSKPVIQGGELVGHDGWSVLKTFGPDDPLELRVSVE